MRRRIQTWTLVVTFAAAGTAAAGVIVTDRQQAEFPIKITGVVVIENAMGNIEVTGGSEATVTVTAERMIRATDGAAVAEARLHVNRVLEGNEKIRIIRTVGAPATNRWNVHVHYTVVIPRTANLKIVSTHTNRIRVAGIQGQVSIKNMTGPVIIDDVGGQVTVENVNGSVTLIAPGAVAANARLTSINGSIAVRTPANANFTWEGETVMGEARTTFPLRGGSYITPTRFRGSVNAPAKVALVTETFGGDIIVVPHGVDDAAARSIRTMLRQFIVRPTPGGVGPMLPTPANRAGVELPLVVQKFYRYATAIGDVKINEIRGAANILTGAGEINLGTVFGPADVISHGGPLTLGEIIGPLTARTDAGNVTVQRAREGGTIITGGGTIQLQYAGGPVRLSSGGGDIVLRQAMDAVTAETRSGDINLKLDADRKGGRVAAKTAKGNILLTLPSGFRADLDATVITSDPGAHSIRSDFPGLSIQREQVGGKTRVRATGKINGGGERLELQAQDGGIQINSDAPRVSPMIP